ncbi:MAG TPA: hypothetical protein H9881_09325 [Candidatus Stackebrandtia excrementipullorum]|nr:hypothetical protein [Candidatus Stackebrandtia excrementipullorum]
MLFADLRDMNTGLLFEAAEGATVCKDGLVNAAATVRSQAANLNGAWEGVDSEAAAAALTADSLPVDGTGEAFGRAAGILTNLGQALEVERANLAATMAQATAIPGIVDDRGLVIPQIPPGTPIPVALHMQHVAAQLTLQIAETVARATQYDMEAAAQLNGEQGADDGANPEEGDGQAPGFRPPAMPSPEEMAGWGRAAGSVLNALGSGGQFGGSGGEFGGSGGEYDPHQPGGGLAAAGPGGAAVGGGMGAGGSFGGGMGGGAVGAGAGHSGMGAAASSGMGPAGAGMGAAAMAGGQNGNNSSSSSNTNTTGGRAGGMGMMPMGMGMGRGMGGDGDGGAHTWLAEDESPFSSDNAAPPIIRGSV